MKAISLKDVLFYMVLPWIGHTSSENFLVIFILVFLVFLIFSKELQTSSRSAYKNPELGCLSLFIESFA